MERIQVLIDKLNEQKRNGESASQLLVTVQLLQQELLRSHASPSPSTSSKVVVDDAGQALRARALRRQRGQGQDGERGGEVAADHAGSQSL